MWDMHSHMSLGRIAAHDAPVEGLLVVAEHGYLVSCSTDNTVRVWDYGAGREVKVWRHPEEFRCVALLRSTGHVVAGTEQHSIVGFPLREVLEEQQRARDEAAAAAAAAAVAEAERQERAAQADADEEARMKVAAEMAAARIDEGAE